MGEHSPSQGLWQVRGLPAPACPRRALVQGPAGSSPRRPASRAMGAGGAWVRRREGGHPHPRPHALAQGRGRPQCPGGAVREWAVRGHGGVGVRPQARAAAASPGGCGRCQARGPTRRSPQGCWRWRPSPSGGASTGAAGAGPVQVGSPGALQGEAQSAPSTVPGSAHSGPTSLNSCPRLLALSNYSTMQMRWVGLPKAL